MPGGKGAFGGPPLDAGMDVFQDPFVLGNVSFAPLLDGAGKITADLVSTVGTYRETYTLAEIAKGCRAFVDAADSFCMRVLETPAFDDSRAEAVRVEIATTVFGVKGEYLLYETAPDSNTFASRHLELDLAFGDGCVSATLYDNFGQLHGPVRLDMIGPDRYANGDSSFVISVERITSKGSEGNDDLTARVTCSAIGVSGTLVDAREDGPDSRVFKTSEVRNQGEPIKMPGASAALGAFQELWYAELNPPPEKDEEAVIIVLRPGPIRKVPKPVRNDPRAITAAWLSP
ncbi:MAG: hypothetical protein N3A38_14275, partial [Planctomycetota bacterium]|nr:hypothetical protein [Planctomycetota bacterium]